MFNVDYNIALKLNNIGKTDFNVTLQILPNISGNQVIEFHVFLNPDKGTQTPLAPIKISPVDRKVWFHVANKSITGIYYIKIHAILSKTSNFTLERIVIDR